VEEKIKILKNQLKKLTKLLYHQKIKLNITNFVMIMSEEG